MHVSGRMPGVKAVSGHGLAGLRNGDAGSPAMLRGSQQQDLERVAQQGRRHHPPGAINLQGAPLLQHHPQLCCAGLQTAQSTLRATTASQ